MERKSIWMTLFEKHLRREAGDYFNSLQNTPKRTLFEGVEARSYLNGDALLSHIEVAPYVRVPEHSHAYSQMGLLLAGELEMVIGGESRILGTHDLFIIPPHIPHQAASGSEGTLLVELYTPLDSTLMKRIS